MKGRPSLQRVRTWLLVGICLAVLAGTLVYAQTGNITLRNSESLAPQAQGPTYVWASAIYGNPPTSVSGNSTPINHTLLLNSMKTGTSAVATYNLSFPSLKDLNGYANEFTLYIPGQVIFANNTSASVLKVTFGGVTVQYYPTQPKTFPWWYGNRTAAYIPANNTLVPYPGPYRTGGNWPYLAFSLNSSTLARNTTIPISITVPAYGEIYISNIVLTATLDVAAQNTASSRTAGLLALPVLGAAVVGIYFVLRKFSAGKYVGTLAAAFSLQVLLAPFFAHSDTVTFQRYAALFYNYGILNLQSWTYGISWLGTILVPPAPMFAAGVTPTLPEWMLLLKLPAIAADLLTFLVLIRILSPRIGESRAYALATVGWLFNPLVVYTSVVHGLGESVVTFLVVITAYFLVNRRFWFAAAGAVVAALTILPAACVGVAAFFSRRLSWWQRAFLIAAPIAAYVAAFVALYQSTSGMTAYLLGLLRRTNYESLLLGAASRSTMTYLYLLDSWFGLYVSPVLGATLLVAVCFVLFLRRRELLPAHALLVVYGSLLAFYFTYEVFYVQHLLWAIPILVALVAFVPGIRPTLVALFVTGVSILALALNLLTDPDPLLAATLSLALFAWLLVPLVLSIPREIVRSLPTGVVPLGVRIAGVGFGLSLGVDAFASYSLPLALVVPAIVATAAFLLLAGLPSGSRSTVRSIVMGAGEVTAVVASLLVVYETATSLPPATLAASWGLAMAGMAELVLDTVAWLRFSVSTPTSVSREPSAAEP